MFCFINEYYFLFLFIIMNITVLSIKLVKHKSKKFIRNFVFGMLFLNFIVHFLKLTFHPYSTYFPNSLRNITFENICAVNTLIFPWIYLSKNKLLNDYLVILGIISGIGACVFPFQSTGFETISLDIIRFYFSHTILFLAPLILVFSGQHKIELKNIFKIPFIFYFVCIIILTNEVILMALGIVDGNMQSLLNPNIRNFALIFGPNHHLKKFRWLYEPFVPKIFKTVPFGPNAGEVLYWPIIWLVIPAYIYLVHIGCLIYFIFNKLLDKKYQSKENYLINYNEA